MRLTLVITPCPKPSRLAPLLWLVETRSLPNFTLTTKMLSPPRANDNEIEHHSRNAPPAPRADYLLIDAAFCRQETAMHALLSHAVCWLLHVTMFTGKEPRENLMHGACSKQTVLSHLLKAISAPGSYARKPTSRFTMKSRLAHKSRSAGSRNAFDADCSTRTPCMRAADYIYLYCASTAVSSIAAVHAAEVCINGSAYI